MTAELEKIGAEVARLKALSAEARAETRDKFADFVADLDDRRQQVADRLEKIEDSSLDAYADIRAGLKDARNRLLIAKRAARARFH